MWTLRIRTMTLDPQHLTISPCESIVETLSQVPSPSLVDQIKNLISDPRHQIELEDLVGKETTKAQELLSDDKFSIQAPEVTPEELYNRLKQYESIVRNLQRIVVLLAKWGTQEHRSLFAGIFARITDIGRHRSGSATWLSLRWHPAIVLMYSAGISAASANKYENLATLLTGRVHYGSGHRIRGLSEQEIALSVGEAMLDQNQAFAFERLPGYEHKFTPRSEYLFQLLQPDLRDMLPLGANYEATFDRFEMLLSLVYADISTREKGHFWCPLGRFAWKHRDSFGIPSVFTEFIGEATSQRDSWPPLQAGLFGGSYQRFEELATRLDQIVSRLNWHS
jgi:hypothetical protein